MFKETLFFYNKIKLSSNLNFKFQKEKLGSISFLIYYIYRLRTMGMISISF